MNALNRLGLPARLLAILLIVVAIDFVANSILFDRANNFELQQDDAERMAEHLVIAHRVMERTSPSERGAVARELSTERFSVTWSGLPDRNSERIDLGTLRQQVLAAEPELAPANLKLHLLPVSKGGEIGGSVVLPDRSVMTFRTEARPAWKLNLGRLFGMALPSVILLMLAMVLFRATLRPLRRLVQATSRVGGNEARPLDEIGPEEVRQLIRAFNSMQRRIHQLLASGSQTLIAIGHDLRTPLARLQLRLENAPIEDNLREEMTHDINEMRELLHSLQIYVESGNDTVAAQRIDIAAMAMTLVNTASDHGAQASYHGPDSLEIMARPVALRRALSNLIENAIHYGGNARVHVRCETDAVEIVVEDDGPGIPPDRMIEALQPFVRLDNARARDTAGMGLGLSIVERAVKAEGGTFRLSNRKEGGLRAAIRLPA